MNTFAHRHSFSLSLGFLTLLPWVAMAKEAEKMAPPANHEAATRLQIFLDRAHFGPGKIDGHYGGFTAKALTLYRKAKDLPPLPASPTPDKASHPAPNDKITGTGEKKADASTSKKESEQDERPEEKAAPEATLPLPDLADMEISDTEPVFISYEVTEADVKSVGPMPTEVPAMAKQKWLPYATLKEALAEKFHTDLDYLHQLNPGKMENLKAGDKLKVPNVEPFLVNGIKELPLLDQIAMSREEADKTDDEGDLQYKGETKKSASKGEAPATDKSVEVSSSDDLGKGPRILPASKISLKVDTDTSMVHLFENGKLAAAFPVTIGSQQTKSPIGDWKVRGIARLPDFRYDKAFLNTGERGEKTYLLPPGPNNMVGVVWIALNKRGIGLHGTSEPDTVGRSTSHGCIRLANWDIARLATRVRAGTAVSIH